MYGVMGGHRTADICYACFALLSAEVNGGSACDIANALLLKAWCFGEAVLYGIRTTARAFPAIEKRER